MFTGIIETTGKIIAIQKKGSNLTLGIESILAKDLKAGQSVSHNGVCLTVESEGKEKYTVTAVKETLTRTNIGLLKKGSIVNLERSLKVGDRLDGHFVQGHVDCTAEVIAITKEKGSWSFKFKGKRQRAKVDSLIIEIGSLCVNGVSLTFVET